MRYLYWNDQVIPIDEIARMLKSNRTIFIQLYDREIFELDFDNEMHMNAAYDELMNELNDKDTYDLGSY